MISYLISDNTDTLVGMRLAGITGVVLKTREEALEEFNDCLNNKEIGILILTENIFDLISEEVMEVKLKNTFPLIVEIQDRTGLKRDPNFITNYINESIGINI